MQPYVYLLSGDPKKGLQALTLLLWRAILACGHLQGKETCLEICTPCPPTHTSAKEGTVRKVFYLETSG